MALYTGKGDDGKTKTLSDKGRISKKALVAEALGSVDELNSLLGYCKSKLKSEKLSVGKHLASDILHKIQDDLFIVQAQLAGSDKVIIGKKVQFLEHVVQHVEGELPEIKSFFIPGATELGGLLDFARAVARRAERAVVRANEDADIKLDKHALAYMNRLSSVLYALARLSAHNSGIKEEPPTYK